MKMRYQVDLIQQISEDDKKRLNNYISEYGIKKSKFIGLDKWLQNWNHSNQVLYKLLGNNLIYEFDYNYEKSAEDVRQEIYGKLFRTDFKMCYHDFYREMISPLYAENIISFEAKTGFNRITDVENFVDNKVHYGFKLKLPGKKTTLQITEGGKPMKALQKIINYFKDDWDFKGFEEFRLIHSMIFNDKIVKGKMCISIHPLDFLTMSDNSLNWSSCMSWTDNGCYHVGTVEMMNSNNVFCCYLKDNDNYYFAKPDEKTGEINTDPLYAWNNKRWRVLSYATKDIIMVGKSYPYKNKELNMTILNKLRELAKKNLGWTYDFGPEPYLDMQYINSSYAMDRARDYLKRSPKKHNILWDTHGMYNDMLNDHGTVYYCIRNKVNKNKIISVSGKAPCLQCGCSTIYDTMYENDYNERFYNVGNVVCEDCLRDTITCDCCGKTMLLEEPYRLNVHYADGTVKVNYRCKKCMEEIKICPDCGKPFFAGSYNHSGFSIDFENAVLDEDFYPDTLYWTGNTSIKANLIDKTYRCYECGKKYRDTDLLSTKIHCGWRTSSDKMPVIAFVDYEKSKKYLKKNLKNFDLNNYTKNMDVNDIFSVECASW